MARVISDLLKEKPMRDLDLLARLREYWRPHDEKVKRMHREARARRRNGAK